MCGRTYLKNNMILQKIYEIYTKTMKYLCPPRGGCRPPGGEPCLSSPVAETLIGICRALHRDVGRESGRGRLLLCAVSACLQILRLKVQEGSKRFKRFKQVQAGQVFEPNINMLNIWSGSGSGSGSAKPNVRYVSLSLPPT